MVPTIVFVNTQRHRLTHSWSSQCFSEVKIVLLKVGEENGFALCFGSLYLGQRLQGTKLGRFYWKKNFSTVSDANILYNLSIKTINVHINLVHIKINSKLSIRPKSARSNDVKTADLVRRELAKVARRKSLADRMVENDGKDDGKDDGIIFQ